MAEASGVKRETQVDGCEPLTTQDPASYGFAAGYKRRQTIIPTLKVQHAPIARITLLIYIGSARIRVFAGFAILVMQP